MQLDLFVAVGIACWLGVAVAGIGMLRHREKPLGWHLRNSWALWVGHGFRPSARPWHRALLIAGAGFLLCVLGYTCAVPRG